ncbi:MAG: glycosyltransferase [Sphingobacteriales bacterium]|nr:MAG: glycosyltransferase [Sphingobacteriales bacterium]
MVVWNWLWSSALGLYLLCSLWFFLCSAIQLHLLWKSWMSRKNASKSAPPTVNTVSPSADQLPMVTIQVPVYNERYVIARLLDALGRLEYPKHLFEIQVLDDSTDDTAAIIASSTSILKEQGFMVSTLHRTERQGFKAGALQAGLPLCRGELIAIFDADFTPGKNFLHQMVRNFNDPVVGGVQGRWAHRNLHENWLTVIQSYLLDSHFTLEQQGRSAAGYYMNFNGTAGMWRKQCIIDSGGWNGEVLTEDLELSYRAQLRGWKFVYDESVAVPADLPADVEAFKAQQFRWAKGMAQASLCHLRSVLRMQINSAKKIHATFHLLSSVSFLAVLGNILLALPIVIGRHYSTIFSGYSELIFLTGLTLPMICMYYNAGTKMNLSRKDFWLHLPLFLVVYMALSAQNTIAVLQGWFGYKTPFVRTPKPDKNNIAYYETSSRLPVTTLFEMFVFVYSQKNHLLLDYILVGSMLILPSVLRLNKKARTIYGAEALLLLPYLMLTKQPLLPKSPIPIQAHAKIDPLNVAQLALQTLAKPIRTRRKELIFNIAFTAVAGLTVLLTRWEKGRS